MNHRPSRKFELALGVVLSLISIVVAAYYIVIRSYYAQSRNIMFSTMLWDGNEPNSMWHEMKFVLPSGAYALEIYLVSGNPLETNGSITGELDYEMAITMRQADTVLAQGKIEFSNATMSEHRVRYLGTVDGSLAPWPCTNIPNNDDCHYLFLLDIIELQQDAAHCKLTTMLSTLAMQNELANSKFYARVERFIDAL